MGMRIAASSCCWWHHSLEDGVRLAAEAGFTAYEPLMFWSFQLHGNLEKMSAAQITALLDAHGMEPAALHIGAIDTAPDVYRSSVDYTKRAIEVAAQTGCNLVVAAGPARTGELFLSFLKALEELIPVMEGGPVRLALENHYRNRIETPADYERIFEHIDSPSIGITLDTGHFTASGVEPETVARRFGAARVFHVHIKDHRGAQSVALGRGTTNNIGTVRALRESGYTGYLSQEIECGEGQEADRMAADGIEYMRMLQEV